MKTSEKKGGWGITALSVNSWSLTTACPCPLVSCYVFSLPPYVLCVDTYFLKP